MPTNLLQGNQGSGGATNAPSATLNLNTIVGVAGLHIAVYELLGAAYDHFYSAKTSPVSAGKLLGLEPKVIGNRLYSVGEHPPVGFTSGPLAGTTQQGCKLTVNTIGTMTRGQQTLVAEVFLPYSQMEAFNPASVAGVLVFP